MKKIFTLLMAVGIVSIASAQSGRFNNGKQDPGYSFHPKQSGLQQINRAYNYKIGSVKMDRRLNSREKAKKIRFLENQRTLECNRAQYSFNKRGHQYDDHRYTENNTHKW
ncbi:MAG: hypothetical protein ABIR15_05885 [Chitinophagaceae bacterium]